MAQIVPNVEDGTAMTTVELLEAEGSAMGFMYLGGVQTLSFCGHGGPVGQFFQCSTNGAFVASFEFNFVWVV